MKHLIAKKVLVKAILIALPHIAPTLDAWTTNRNVNMGSWRWLEADGMHMRPKMTEINPFFKPVAGTPAMYGATNTDVLFTQWLMKKHRRAGTILFWATQASHLAFSQLNIRDYRRERAWEKQYPWESINARKGP